MPAHLDPIDKDGTAFRVLLNGRRIGLVRKNVTLGSVIWQHQVSDDAAPQGVFSEAQDAADQLVANRLGKMKRKKT